MAGDAAFLFFVDDAAGLFEADAHSFNSFFQFAHRDRRFVLACGEQGSLVDEVLQIGPRKSRRQLGEFAQLDIIGHLDASGVHLENRLASLVVGPVDEHMPIEATRSHQSGVEGLRAVGCPHHDHALIGGKPIHLD